MNWIVTGIKEAHDTDVNNKNKLFDFKLLNINYSYLS